MPVPRATAPLTGALVAACLVALGSGPAAAAAQCDDLVVSHAPDGSAGEVGAVAITSQVLDSAVPGWAAVSWETAAGTALREVLVVGEDGVHTLSGTAKGTAEDALELHFCGQVEADPGEAATASMASGPGELGTATAVVAVTRTGATTEDGTPAEDGTGAGDRTASDPVAVPGMLGAAAGLFVGVVVLLLSRSTHRERLRA